MLVRYINLKILNLGVVKYYLDCCIWRDYFENRSDNFRPLGDWAFELIKKIIQAGDNIVVSDLVEEELLSGYDRSNVLEILSIVPKDILVNVVVSEIEIKEAVVLSKKFGVPLKDVLHAVLARDHNSVLVTRDKHFGRLSGFFEIKKPEKLI